MKHLLLFQFLIAAFILDAQNKTETPDSTQVLTIVDEMPSFPGGEIEMIKFLKSNLKYPSSEKKLHISGSCFLSFIVETNGQINRIKILQGVEGGAACDREVVRVINRMPVWNPGKQHGKYVRVQYNLPVKFILY